MRRWLFESVPVILITTTITGAAIGVITIGIATGARTGCYRFASLADSCVAQ